MKPETLGFWLSHAWEVVNVDQDLLRHDYNCLHLGKHLGLRGLVAHAIASEDCLEVLGAAVS